MERIMPPPLLAIEGLHVSYNTREGAVPAVVDCSLHVRPGECVGLVGESGCGKTTVALAIMRYLGANGRIVGGRIVFTGRDLLQCSPRMLRQIRGADVAMVYQEPTAALDVTVAAGITELTKEVRHTFGTSMLYIMLCETERPPLQQATATHSIACHIPLERLLQYSTVSSIEPE